MFLYIRYTYICITPAIVNQNQNFCTTYSDYKLQCALTLANINKMLEFA